MRLVDRALDLAGRFPLDFTIQYPPRREYFQERFRIPAAPWGGRVAGDWLLYVHVPFCEAKCYYCNFAVDTRQDPGLHARYVAGLASELAWLAEAVEPDAPLRGIDIGGGTPTSLSPDLLARLLAALAPWVRRAGPGGLSIETTPRIASEHPERLAVLREGGVARVSMGVQSTNDELLAMVNRSRQRQMAERAAENLRAAGFERVNVDLIFGLPGQSARAWAEDLRTVIALGPDSITTYDCLYRGKGRALTRRTAEKPTPEAYGALYDQAFTLLAEAGYRAPYGSVNFARQAGETGTSPYFEGRLLDGLPYLGLGNYASSQLDDLWFFAPYGVGAWLEAVERGEHLPTGDVYRLPAAELMAKYVLLSLNFGILDPRRFARRFGEPLEARFGEQLEVAIARGWLAAHGGMFGVRPGAFGALPWLRALFYSAEALDWLEAQALATT